MTLVSYVMLQEYLLYLIRLGRAAVSSCLAVTTTTHGQLPVQEQNAPRRAGISPSLRADSGGGAGEKENKKGGEREPCGEREREREREREYSIFSTYYCAYIYIYMTCTCVGVNIRVDGRDGNVNA